LVVEEAAVDAEADGRTTGSEAARREEPAGAGDTAHADSAARGQSSTRAEPSTGTRAPACARTGASRFAAWASVAGFTGRRDEGPTARREKKR